MPRINVGKVLSNPQFKDNFIVYRQIGSWQGGRFVQSAPITLNLSGVVVPGEFKDIQQVPEGDRTSEIMVFLSTQPLYESCNNEDNEGFQGTSDQILWEGHKYRIYRVKNWSKYGFYRAIGISMEGD